MAELRTKFLNNESYCKSLANTIVKAYPEEQICQICGEKTKILKTSKKTCYSLLIGKFTLVEGFSYCEKHKRVSINSKEILKYRSLTATEIVEKGFKVTFDLLVKIGLLRFRDHHQLEEIKGFLKCSSARIDLSLSTISFISKRFLEFCKLLHERFENEIKKEIKKNRGYVLHFDGTTEKQAGSITYVLMDSLSGHLLLSRTIDTERYSTIVPLLKEVKEKYDIPLLTISDLMNFAKNASFDVFGPSIYHLFCHYHFLKTFISIFIKKHTSLKTIFSKRIGRYGIKSSLTKEVRLLELNFHFKSTYFKNFFDVEEYWNKSQNILHSYYFALKWILKYSQDSAGKGIPFDLPYLDLHERLERGTKLIRKIFKNSSSIEKKYQKNFEEIVSKVNKVSAAIKHNVDELSYSKKWFTKLRSTLYLEASVDKKEALAPLSKRYMISEEEANMIPNNITKYLEEINKEISIKKNQDKIKILKFFRDQTNKYKDNLAVPVIGPKMIIPHRTNNFLERFFRNEKTNMRRKTGRSSIIKEFNSFGDLLPYYLSMKEHSLFKNIFNDEQKIIEQFSELCRNNNFQMKNVIGIEKRVVKQNSSDKNMVLA